MIAFLNLKFWPKSQPLAVMAAPANRLHLQGLWEPQRQTSQNTHTTQWLNFPTGILNFAESL
ncbi:hypothetical protein [Desmonostoc muscorum]|uniref:hypothetical protein n=1 Tax=Desmonostoc muscorum TaxID=1179 RepID=UPI001F1836DE|nr:hypothetical protein [Desmonostoc muscorum]